MIIQTCHLFGAGQRGLDNQGWTVYGQSVTALSVTCHLCLTTQMDICAEHLEQVTVGLPLTTVIPTLLVDQLTKHSMLVYCEYKLVWSMYPHTRVSAMVSMELSPGPYAAQFVA